MATSLVPAPFSLRLVSLALKPPYTKVPKARRRPLGQTAHHKCISTPPRGGGAIALLATPAFGRVPAQSAPVGRTAVAREYNRRDGREWPAMPLRPI